MKTPALRGQVNATLLMTGIASVLSGFLMQIHYHMHQGTSPIWGIGYPTWILIHQAVSFAFVAVVAWHLQLNWKATWAICTRRGAWRRLNLYVVTTFLLPTATAMAAWTAYHIFGHRIVEKALVEIHDKVAIPLSVLMVLHTWRRRSRLFRRLARFLISQ